MKHCRWLTAILALSLAGCVVRGNPQAKAVAAPPPPLQPAGRPQGTPPAPRPEPLSIPQTQAQLPPAQPIDPQALAATQPPSQPVEVEAQAPPRTVRRPPGHAVSPPAPAVTQSATQVAAPQPAPPAESEVRPQVQEILPPEELKRLQESLAARRQEIHRVLDPAQTRKLTSQQTAVVSRIQSFLQQSEEAEKRGDLRQADALGERAQILARDFQGGIR